MPLMDIPAAPAVGSAASAVQPTEEELLKVRLLDRPGVVLGLMLVAFLVASGVLVLGLGVGLTALPVLVVFAAIIWFLTRADRHQRAVLLQLKQNYRRERDRFIALINTLDSAVIATDRNGRITLYNSATLSLLNTHASLRGEPFSHIFRLSDPKQQAIDVIRETADAKRAIERTDLSIQVGKNERQQLQVMSAPIIANFGGPSGGYVVMIRDITKQKTLDEERNEFVSVTSHELRTPIAVVEASLATLMTPAMKAQLKPEAVKLIETAHARIEHLGRLVKDLATLAQAQGQFLDIEIKPIDPKTLVTAVKVSHQQEASAKGLNLLLHPMIELHPVLTSPTYVHEIISNYVSNAIKYTDQGGVVSIGAENGPNNSIRFWVEDSGMGISKADQAKLFTKFFRAEDFHTRQTEGTGLGLYIVKQMANRIGAKVWCTSELGKGSIFFLEVPPVGALKKDSKKITTAEIEDFANAI